MNKEMEKDLVRTFRKYNLIQNLDSDVNQSDARIVIYPSILLAVTVENINSLYDMTEQTLREYASTREQGIGSEEGA